MGSSYSGDHIAEDHIHSDITMYHLGTTTEVPPWNGQLYITVHTLKEIISQTD